MKEIEEKIVSLRKDGLTYREIQIKLGNPAKKITSRKKDLLELETQYLEKEGQL